MADPRRDPQYKLRLPAELKRQIEEAARHNLRSMNAEIVARLEQTFRPVETREEQSSVSEDDIRRVVRVLVESMVRADEKGVTFRLDPHDANSDCPQKTDSRETPSPEGRPKRRK